MREKRTLLIDQIFGFSPADRECRDAHGQGFDQGPQTIPQNVLAQRVRSRDGDENRRHVHAPSRTHVVLAGWRSHSDRTGPSQPDHTLSRPHPATSMRCCGSSCSHWNPRRDASCSSSMPRCVVSRARRHRTPTAREIATNVVAKMDGLTARTNTPDEAVTVSRSGC